LSELARLLVPALRWDRAHGFRYLSGLIDDALELGVGGFCIEGGPRDEVAALAGRLHAESRSPVLIAARAERGAGESIEGLTQLPSFRALTSVAVVESDGHPALEPETVRRAARLTAREFRNVGVNWALAPVCEAGDSLRTASSDPAIVGAVVGEWIDAAQAESIVSTAIGFPASDPRPISAAVDAGVAAVMIANVRAPRLIDSELRGAIGFEGLVVTPPVDADAGVLPSDEKQVCLEAIVAGCDLILAPGDLNGVSESLAVAAARGTISAQRLRSARERVDRWCGWARPNVAREVSLDDVMWSRQLADSCVRFVQGSRPRIGASVEVVCVGDIAIEPFVAVLRAMHIQVIESPAPSGDQRAPLLVLCAPASNFPPAREYANVAARSGRDAAVVIFDHSVTISGAPAESAVLQAWEPSRAMMEAAARALASSR
jgi:hypothetical protein